MLLALALFALLAALLPCGLFFANLRIFTPPPAQPLLAPGVSVLIPARNEAGQIAEAVQSVLANRGSEFEVIVLDDHSEDQTGVIVASFAADDARVRLERAAPLPPGWNGKMHACHLLAEQARHPHLLFVDADVRLQSDALARLGPLLAGTDLLSGVPCQITGTFSEKLLIPLIHFVLLGYLPLARMRQSSAPALGAGCGQLLFTTAEAYRRSGGHAAMRTSLHDGLHLPRLYREAGLRTDLTDLTPLATCRLYDTNVATWRGLAKNAQEGMGAWRVIFPMTALLLLGQVAPYLLFVWSLGHPVPQGTRWVILAACLCGWQVRLTAADRFHQSRLSALLHPLGILALLAIQWWARLRTALRLGATWKGRVYHEP